MLRHLVPAILGATLLWMNSMPAGADMLKVATACGKVGSNVEILVQLRDRGVPPSQVLTATEKTFGHDPEVQAFMRWKTLFVYEMSGVDAAWIRQQVELQCFQMFKN